MCKIKTPLGIILICFVVFYFCNILYCYYASSAYSDLSAFTAFTAFTALTVFSAFSAFAAFSSFAGLLCLAAFTGFLDFSFTSLTTVVSSLTAFSDEASSFTALAVLAAFGASSAFVAFDGLAFLAATDASFVSVFASAAFTEDDSAFNAAASVADAAAAAFAALVAAASAAAFTDDVNDFVSLDFLLAAVFLLMIPLEAALSRAFIVSLRTGAAVSGLPDILSLHFLREVFKADFFIMFFAVLALVTLTLLIADFIFGNSFTSLSFKAYLKNNKCYSNMRISKIQEESYLCSFYACDFAVYNCGRTAEEGIDERN